MKHLSRRTARTTAVSIALVLIAGCQAAGASSTTVAPTGSATRPTMEPSDSPSAPAPTASPPDSPSASPTTVAAVDPRADGLDVGFGEFAITLEAPVIRPGPVTLVVHNAGTMTHGFELKLERPGSNSGSGNSGKGSGSGRDREKIETRTFQSGETLRVEANLQPGVYEVECYVSGHASMGMRTTLTVQVDAPLVDPDPIVSAAGSVRIVQFAFVAPELDVAPGTTVTWTNDDPAPHTVTADGAAFDSKQLDPGDSFSTVFDTAGSYVYHCDIHPTMVGTVLVH
jgi:plastocyanin